MKKIKIQEDIITVNKWKSRFNYPIKGVIMHSMYGTQRGSISWFKNPASKVSAHYNISVEGDISMTVEEKDTAWHAGNVSVAYDKAPQLLKDFWGVNPNFITIGVEMEDKKNKKHKYPKDQYEAAVVLVADICKRNEIEVNAGYILMHKETDPLNKFDPWGNWDQDRFIRDINSYIEEGGEHELEGNFYPYAKIVKIRTDVDILNVRSSPTTKAQRSGSKFLRGGNEVEVVGFVKGERIESEISGETVNTQFWWKSKLGNYFWGGGTTLVPTLDNFPEGMSNKDKILKGNIMDELKNKIGEFEGVVKQAEQKVFDAEAVLEAEKANMDDLVLKLGALKEELAAVEAEAPAVVVEPVTEEVAEEAVAEEVVAPIEEAVEETVIEEVAVEEPVETIAEEEVLEEVEELVEEPVVEEESALQKQFNEMVAAMEALKAKIGGSK